MPVKRPYKRYSLGRSIVLTALTGLVILAAQPASFSKANTQAPRSGSPLLNPEQPRANSEEIPRQILKSGVVLSEKTVSPNSRQLAEQIGLLSILEKMQAIRAASEETVNKDEKIDFLLLQTESLQLLQETNFSIDFVLAELSAENSLYSSVLSGFNADRDKAVFKTNASSFITNGVLWTVAEAYDIPTYRYPKLSIPSGINGILAGIVPSVASAYAMHQLSGKKRTSESDANMLAKLFDYDTNPEIEYPHPVWTFLNSVPSEDTVKKTRREQLVNRWIKDKNIPSFTDKTSKKQLDVITASESRKKGLTIDVLSTRQTMLMQLSAEILKMKRLLLELSMVANGEKSI